MSVLEGLAHGLAVVATPVGAHAEVIEPERSGLLVPPGDVAALAAALARVIGDPALRERLRAGARQRFLERFDVRFMPRASLDCMSRYTAVAAYWARLKPSLRHDGRDYRAVSSPRLR